MSPAFTYQHIKVWWNDKNRQMHTQVEKNRWIDRLLRKMIPILPELIQTGKKYRYTFNMVIHTWKSIIHKIQGRLSLITTLGQRYKNNILWYVSLLNTYTHARRDCYTGTDGCNVKTKLSPALSRGSNVFYNKYIRKYRAAWDFSTQKRNVYSQYNGSN